MKQTTIFFLIGVVIVTLCTLNFLLGAWYSCNAGGGTLYGLTCRQVEIIGACKDLEGDIYKVPTNYTVSPFFNTSK